MGLFDKAVDFLSGSTVQTIADVVTAYFPPSMSDVEKSDLQLKIQAAENAKDIETLKLFNEGDRDFNSRIIAMEGAAEDLKSVPYIGAAIILARGAQRPIWGFFTLYMDYMFFSKSWDITWKTQEGALVLAINLMVLIFLFGERAVKYIIPIVMRYIGVKNGGAK